jgi:hypothetical protein
VPDDANENSESSLMSIRIEQRVELSGVIQSRQIVKTTYVGIADKDLRNGAPMGPFQHFGAPLQVKVHANLFDFRYPPGLQQSLSHLAKRADCGGIHQYGTHRLTPLLKATVFPAKTRPTPAIFRHDSYGLVSGHGIFPLMSVAVNMRLSIGKNQALRVLAG